jgi:hypothetical protein
MWQIIALLLGCIGLVFTSFELYLDIQKKKTKRYLIECAEVSNNKIDKISELKETGWVIVKTDSYIVRNSKFTEPDISVLIDNNLEYFDLKEKNESTNNKLRTAYGNNQN